MGSASAGQSKCNKKANPKRGIVEGLQATGVVVNGVGYGDVVVKKAKIGELTVK